MSDERVLSDLDIVLGYLRAESTASDDELVTLINDLDNYWPDGKKLFSDLKHAIISVYINKETANDA